MRPNQTITGEFWAEKLATEIGKLLNIECAKVDIGTYKGRLGSMSYNIIDKKFEDDTSLIEGVEFIQNIYPYYDKDKLKDSKTGDLYTVQMIEKSIKEILNKKEIYKLIIFDILIGNSDRHPSNWAILAKKTFYKTEKNLWDVWHDYSLCPLYDNGSSLCSYEQEENIDDIIKDTLRFEALINSKSKSAIGWENQRPIRQFDLLRKIKEASKKDTLPFVERIKYCINENSINQILNQFDDDIISFKMKKLIKMFILERRKRILEIYDINEDKEND